MWKQKTRWKNTHTGTVEEDIPEELKYISRKTKLDGEITSKIKKQI